MITRKEIIMARKPEGLSTFLLLFKAVVFLTDIRERVQGFKGTGYQGNRVTG